MTTSVPRGSAQIYQFPPRGRFADGAGISKPLATAMPRIAKVAIGESWYHEEAIREAEKLNQH